MAMFAYVFIGLIVGVLASVAMPETTHVKLRGSALLGMVGGALGGIIGVSVDSQSNLSTLKPLSIVLAIIVSFVVSVGMHLVSRRRRYV